MARISNTKGIEQAGGSRYDLIMQAAARARSYSADNQPLVDHFNRRGMTALREIEQGLVSREENEDLAVNKYRQHFPKTEEADPILDN